MNNKINIADILKDCPKKPRYFVYNEHLLGTTDPYTEGGSE
ncbi:hypothetical protein [Leyella stercorea]|nr:hypothetical protein [Leyella stercorea]